MDKFGMALPKTAPHRLVLTLFLALAVSSCTYVKYANLQAEYSRIQNAEPGQVNLKHMIDRETFFVYGRSVDPTGSYTRLPMAIAAYSSKFRANERVDIMYFTGTGTHYGLNLPEGRYDLLVFADSDGDGIFGRSEVVGQRQIELSKSSVPDKVLGQSDIRLTLPFTIGWVAPIDVPSGGGPKESLFYPSGTIRSLNDPIFDRSFSTLGMYDPASFMERAPTMFYALEEDLGHKIPVVFVHGIGGSARDFESLVGQLDRKRYKPWFFYYPSGGDLDQLAELFYRIFLSGKVVRLNGMPLIIVAHSMGGLVAREAINKYEGISGENQAHLLITMASPFGGHPAAAEGEEHGLIVLPSWRDLNPENQFIRDLYRKPIPDFVHHDLLYAYRNPDAFRVGENSDGVVSLASQLHPQAQRQSDEQFGFNSTHTEILDNDEVAAHVLARMETVKNIFPPSHLKLLALGGFDVALGKDYSPTMQYLIHAAGKYMMALTKRTIVPFYPEQERFVEVANGEQAPQNEIENAWLKFLSEYPEFKDD
jgi:pimeloyl-ACP methyl ester carboxylesterase